MEDLMKIALSLKYLSQNGDQEHMHLRMNDRHTFHTPVLLIGSTNTDKYVSNMYDISDKYAVPGVISLVN